VFFCADELLFTDFDTDCFYIAYVSEIN